LYIHENTLFARLQLKNTTNINYDVEQLRFYIRDKNQGKRTATQELEIKPLLIDGDTAVIRGTSKNTLVVALPKFTIPDGKNLIAEIMEKDGGRHLALKIKNRKLIKAKTI
jgi:conjugative transposon TraN protein